MKLITGFLLLIFLNSSFGFDNEKYEMELKARKEKAEIENNQLSDDELVTFLEGMFKYLPEGINDIKQKSPLERKKTLNNFRKFYTSGGMSIPELIETYKQYPEMKESMAKIWANDTLGVEYAEKVLLNLSKQEYQTIIDVGKSLVKNNKLPFDRLGRAFIHENFPKQLDFINIEYLAVYENSFDIYLYKGFGRMKTIGYTVKQEENGDWNLYSYNFLNSWGKNLVDIESIKEE